MPRKILRFLFVLVQHGGNSYSACSYPGIVAVEELINFASSAALRFWDGRRETKLRRYFELVLLNSVSSRSCAEGRRLFSDEGRERPRDDKAFTIKPEITPEEIGSTPAPPKFTGQPIDEDQATPCRQLAVQLIRCLIHATLSARSEVDFSFLPSDVLISACECRSADQLDLQDGRRDDRSTPVGYGVSLMMRS
jgi:hypothetical protein